MCSWNSILFFYHLNSQYSYHIFFSLSHRPFFEYVVGVSFFFFFCFFFCFVIWCLSCRTACEQLILLLSTWFFHLKSYFFFLLFLWDPEFTYFLLYMSFESSFTLSNPIYLLLYIFFFEFIRSSCLFQRLSNGQSMPFKSRRLLGHRCTHFPVVAGTKT